MRREESHTRFKGRGEHSVNELEKIIEQREEELHLIHSATTEPKISVVDFLTDKGILKDGCTKWIAQFPGKKEFNIVDLIEEYNQLNQSNKE